MDLGVTAVMLPELDFEEQIELCASLGVRYYQYRPRVIPGNAKGKPYGNWGNHEFDLTPERFLKEGAQLTRRLRDGGMEPWGTVPVMNCDMSDDEVKPHLEGAAAAEAKCVRCSAPRFPDGPLDYQGFLKRTVDQFAHIAERIAAPLGIKLIVETHRGSLFASPALALNLCRNFSPQRVGAIFDIANFMREGELAPRMAVAVLREYIDCVHIGGGRRIISGIDAFGAKQTAHQMCSMEEADLHIPTWVAALREAGARAPLIIEDYTPNVPGAERLSRSARFLHKVLKGASSGER